MNLAHVHLILNHVPVLGVVFAGILLGIARLRRDTSWERVALWFVVSAAVLTVPVYLTGEPAEHALERAGSVSEVLVERHEESAGVALAAVAALGLLALAGALWFRRAERIPRAFAAAVLVLALSATALFAWTGFLGGQIRHTEMLSGPAGAPPSGAARD